MDLKLMSLFIQRLKANELSCKLNFKEIAEYLEVDLDELKHNLKNICNHILTRKYEIKTLNGCSLSPWISKINFNKSTLEFKFNNELKNYVFELNTLANQYEMIDLIALNSFYSVRIYSSLKKNYTLCKKKKNEFKYSIQELRALTGTEDKYSTIGTFQRHVLSVAIREINKKTDLSIEIKILKECRKYIGFCFVVTEKSIKNKLVSRDLSKLKKEVFNLKKDGWLHEDIAEILDIEINDLKTIIGVSEIESEFEGEFSDSEDEFSDLFKLK